MKYEPQFGLLNLSPNNKSQSSLWRESLLPLLQFLLSLHSFLPSPPASHPALLESWALVSQPCFPLQALLGSMGRRNEKPTVWATE